MMKTATKGMMNWSMSYHMRVILNDELMFSTAVCLSVYLSVGLFIEADLQFRKTERSVRHYLCALISGN